MASTQKTPPAHRRPRRPRRPRRNGELVVGITIVAVLIAGGTVATIAATLRGGQAGATTSVSTAQPQAGAATTPAATPAPTSASPTPTPTPTPTDPAGAPVAACRTTVTAAEAAVSAARTGVLAHKIALAQTNSAFKRTRPLGPSDQTTFAQALAVYERIADGCNGLSSSAQPAGKTCATKAVALHTIVVAGQAVMKDWASHLHNMALHADNEMSATQARAAWIAAWKSAPANLDTFSAADAASTKPPSCPAG